ncbi:MAG: glycosyltransferase, partial [Proteobacteria bacterium]|nr:glycosyltransferase [Pseudomonadota bacterium]
VLGLRDVMDEARTVKHQWKEKKIFQVMDTLYSEIWVYGDKALYDPIKEYGIPAAIQKKLQFTGYIPRNTPDKKIVDQVRAAHVQDHKSLVLVTIGGGKDGFALVDACVQLLEMKKDTGCRLAFEMVVVSGPFLPEPEQVALEQRVLALGGKLYRFYHQMNALIAASDLLVCMGGYNTLCECISHSTPALVIPREKPRKEQLIRARAMEGKKMVEVLPWEAVTPGTLEGKIMGMLDRIQGFKQAMANFPMTGIHRIQERVNRFREGEK